MPRINKRATEADVISRVEQRLGGEAMLFVLLEYVQQLRQAVGRELNTLRALHDLAPLDNDTLPRLDRQRFIQALRQKLRDRETP